MPSFLCLNKRVSISIVDQSIFMDHSPMLDPSSSMHAKGREKRASSFVDMLHVAIPYHVLCSLVGGACPRWPQGVSKQKPSSHWRERDTGVWECGCRLDYYAIMVHSTPSVEEAPACALVARLRSPPTSHHWQASFFAHRARAVPLVDHQN